VHEPRDVSTSPRQACRRPVLGHTPTKLPLAPTPNSSRSTRRSGPASQGTAHSSYVPLFGVSNCSKARVHRLAAPNYHLARRKCCALTLCIVGAPQLTTWYGGAGVRSRK
jgi:hypothetical protein